MKMAGWRIAESWLEVLAQVLARYIGILKKCNLLLAESYLRFFSILAEMMDAFSRKYGIYGLTADKNFFFFAHSCFGQWTWMKRNSGHLVRGFALLTDCRNYETRENRQYHINGLTGLAMV